MSVINTNAKEIHCKILYCGPEKSGKKSALLYIKSRFREKQRDFWILPFKKEIYCLVLFAGRIFGFQTFFHIYNLNNESQEDNQNLLRGTDGLLFMASSDPMDRQNNIRSFSEMEVFLRKERENLFKIPLVLQYNKKDLASAMPIRELRMDLNKYNSRDFESSVSHGEFVLEPLKHLCKLTLSRLKSSDL